MTARKTGLNTNSGSPPPGEPEYLLVGMLRRPHGVHGDIVMHVATDFPERLKSGTEVFVGLEHSSRIIAESRQHAQGLVVRFQAMDTPEIAGSLRNQPVFVSASNRPVLPPGQYYHHQLLGLEVIDDRGASLGHLREILQTGANDVYVVQMDDQRELLLPAIDSVLLGIDVGARTIRVHLLEGLAPRKTGAPARHAPSGRKRNAKRERSGRG